LYKKIRKDRDALGEEKSEKWVYLSIVMVDRKAD